MPNIIYRHYTRANENKFSYKSFKPISNWELPWNKPHGGLWTSRIDVERSWKEWCDSEEPDWIANGYFDVQLKDNANILYLKNIQDIKKLFGTNPKYILQCAENLMLKKFLFNKYNENQIYDPLEFPMFMPDFERMYKDGVDAIDVEISDLYGVLYGWDCDSTLIMNPDVIIPFN